jgi:hypothetical protein
VNRLLIVALVEVDHERAEASLRDHVALEEGGECAVAKGVRQASTQGFASAAISIYFQLRNNSPWVVTQAKIASYDVLE